jgi:MFS-type transporter involved in bile tolerance (Atg22 family)
MTNDSKSLHNQNHWIVYDCKSTAYFLLNATTLFAIYDTILLFFEKMKRFQANRNKECSFKS